MSAPRRAPRRVLVAAAIGCLAALLPASSASAHNSFVSSDPADGTTLTAAPASISMVFAKAVPLDTAEVTVVLPDGSRTDASLTHGPSGDTEVVAALPPMPAGLTSIRWRLIGADGHVVTGRIRLTIADSVSADTSPPVSVSTAPTGVADPSTADLADDQPSAASDVGRWLLRALSLFALIAALGALVTTAAVDDSPEMTRLCRRVLRTALPLLAGLSLAQIATLAHDLQTGSFTRGLDTALGTDTGVALLARAAACVALAALATSALRPDAQSATSEPQLIGIASAGLAVLGSFAWMGHSRSDSWPGLGIPLEIVHLGAAIAWLGPLAIIGIAAGRTALRPTVLLRLSAIAAGALAVVVATGVAQALRLSGLSVFSHRHGALLAAKVALVIAMAVLGWWNRGRLRSPSLPLTTIRRTIIAEVALGAAVLGATASLVVAPLS